MAMTIQVFFIHVLKRNQLIMFQLFRPEAVFA